jgi:hypothetical protein
MNSSTNRNINSNATFPIKKCWLVGNNIVVVIDKAIVQTLGINEQETFVEEVLIDDGILLRIRRTQEEHTNVGC